MAEHLIQDTTLTGIADKIRSLLGLTGKMSPAQMQTNLTTEQANITAALAALTEKGVDVPAGANSNALAGLIAAIESGGGGPMIMGTFTVADTTNDLTLEGVLPPSNDPPMCFFVFEAGTSWSNSTHTKNRVLALFYGSELWEYSTTKDFTYVSVWLYQTSGSNSWVASQSSVANIFKLNGVKPTSGAVYMMAGNMTKGDLHFKTAESSYSFLSGRKYIWGVLPRGSF